jgi:hypothetical protein
LGLDPLQPHHDLGLPAPTTDADLFVGRRTDLVDIEKGTIVIRISEADYAAAMSDHTRYIREAERFGPIWADLKKRRANAEVDRRRRIRAFTAAQFGVISSFLAALFRTRKVGQCESAS